MQIVAFIRRAAFRLPIARGLVLVLIAWLAGVPYAAAGQFVAELQDRVFLTGNTSLAAGKLGGFKVRKSWRFDFREDGTFTMSLQGEWSELGGTFVATGKARHCTLDAESLDAFTALVEEVLPAADAVAVISHKLKVVLGAKRPARRLHGTLKLTVETAAGPKKARLKFAGNAVPRRVLVLDDLDGGNAIGQVLDALVKRKHEPINGGFYQTFEDVELLRNEVECVILLQGNDFATVLAEGMDEELAEFLESGGGLVRTEWAAYSGGPDPSLLIDVLLPVVYPEIGYSSGATWNRVAKGHLLGRKVPKTFSTPGAGFNFLTAKPGATVIYAATVFHADEDVDFPMLTEMPVGDGRVVHVNHDMSYSVPDLAEPVLQILVNAAEFSAP